MLGLWDSLEIFTTIVGILDTLGTKVELGLALESSRLTYSKGLRERNVEEKSRGKGQATSIVEWAVITVSEWDGTQNLETFSTKEKWILWNATWLLTITLKIDL